MFFSYVFIFIYLLQVAAPVFFPPDPYAFLISTSQLFIFHFAGVAAGGFKTKTSKVMLYSSPRPQDVGALDTGAE